MRSWLLSNISVYIIANILFAYSLVGCQPIQRSSINPSSSNVSGHSSATTSGPIDSGGENLINGVALESYRVDVTALDEFKLIKPYLHYLSVAYHHDFTDFAKMRNWYFVPVSLADLSNRSVGVDIKNGTTQTIALQGQDEIWLDNNLYKKQSSEEKAKIILHEIVRTLESLKYQSVKQICREWLRADNSCEDYQLLYNEVKEMQPLQLPEAGVSGDLAREQDTSDIRDMTVWILSLNENILPDAIYKRFKAFEFDQRYFADFDLNQKLLWPSKHINPTKDEINFLLDQILDVNNWYRDWGSQLVLDTGDRNTGNPNTGAMDILSLNFVKDKEVSKPYYILPNKNDPQYNKEKERLYEFYAFPGVSDFLDKLKEADIRWVYGKMGPAVLFSANVDSLFNFRIDPTSENDATAARNYVKKFLGVRRGYFLFSPTKSQNSTVTDLQLFAIDFQTTLVRSSKDFGYVAETTDKDKVLFCTPSRYGAPFFPLLANHQFEDSLQIIRRSFNQQKELDSLKEYVSLSSDPFFNPSCSIKEMTEIVNLDSQPSLFKALARNPDELDGWSTSSDPFWAKNVSDAKAAIAAFEQCEHPQPGSTISNPCRLSATNPPHN